LWNAILALHRGYVLVAYRADRLARSVYLSEYINRAVRKKRAKIEVVDGSRNGDSPEDVFVRQVMAAYAEMERKIIAARTKAAMLRHQSNGIAMGSVPPYGKQAGPERCVLGKNGQPKMQKTWIDNPEEQKIIKMIRSMRARSCNYREIARLLNKKGVPARGKRWHHTSIRQICKNAGAI
jgi:DNA invertase Pin-like site-specific DNA recombinase